MPPALPCLQNSLFLSFTLAAAQSTLFFFSHPIPNRKYHPKVSKVSIVNFMFFSCNFIYILSLRLRHNFVTSITHIINNTFFFLLVIFIHYYIMVRVKISSLYVFSPESKLLGNNIIFFNFFINKFI